MKVLSRDYNQRRFRLVVNSVAGRRDGEIVHRRLEQVADRFNLNIAIELLGSVPYDDMVVKSVREQRLFTDRYPGCEAADALRRIARNIVDTVPETGIGWESMFAMRA
jgi:flagellar biosynthesis protein FlhG